MDHSGVKTLFPSYKDRVICHVVIRREYGADIKGGGSLDLGATVIFVTLRNSDLIFSLVPQNRSFKENSAIVQVCALITS